MYVKDLMNEICSMQVYILLLILQMLTVAFTALMIKSPTSLAH